ncbi:MAG TPA: hypothetical protein VGV86_12325 [Acidimicrobiales bacterium]|nr:hypothetical protein [Acidimicrobiales bacterium]
MATIPLQSVEPRAGAVPNQDMVVVLEESATKIDAKAGGGTGLDLETVLSVRAWVRGRGQVRYCWFDVHVFDECDTVIRSETLPMEQVGVDQDGGHVFAFEGSIYRGTGASPGSVWLAPDARKLQYRVYYEVDGTVFTDGLLRQHEIPPDSALTHCGPPSRNRRSKVAPAGHRDTASVGLPALPSTVSR